MTDRGFPIKKESVVKPMSDKTKIILIRIQKKIQNLQSDAANSGFLQQLLHEASQLIGTSDKEAGQKIEKHSGDLNFYLDGGVDDLVKFYRSKAETLTIIAKQVGS